MSSERDQQIEEKLRQEFPDLEVFSTGYYSKLATQKMREFEGYFRCSCCPDSEFIIKPKPLIREGVYIKSSPLWVVLGCASVREEDEGTLELRSDWEEVLKNSGYPDIIVQGVYDLLFRKNIYQEISSRYHDPINPY